MTPWFVRPSWADWKHSARSDLASSAVVFLVALPLCMGIAVASGMPVAAGLISGIIGGIVVGYFAGSPLQVSGPAAGLTVLVFDSVQRYGIERIGVIVLAAGALQILMGLLRFGIWFRAVSPAVIHGMLAGIGVLILASQFHVMVDDQPQASGWRNLITIPPAIEKGLPPPALETAEQRSEVRARMQRLSDLHLQQMELVEEVHHALSAVAPDSAASDSSMRLPPRSSATSVAGVFSPATGVQSSPTAATSTESDESAERDPWQLATAEVLQSLAPRQRAVLDGLRELQKGGGNGTLVTAIAATETALASLEAGRIDTARVELDAAEAAVREVRDTTKHHRWAAAIGMLTIGVLLAWKSFGQKRFPAVAAPLVATAFAAIMANVLQLPVLFVEVPDSLWEEAFFPNLGELAGLLDPTILAVAVQFALIASAETLLCATAVDQLHRGPRTDYDRELIAQGIGNVCCGMLRALPVSGVIVRSSANVVAGAQTRTSTMLHGMWLLLMTVLCASMLRMIPTSALAAVLVYTGFKLVDYKTAWRLWQQSRFEAVVFIGTVVGIVAMGLLYGVVFGLLLSVARLLYEFSRLEIEVEEQGRPKEVTLRLRGNVTFLTLPRLAQALDSVSPEAELRLDVEYVDYFDHACRELLHDWERKNEPFGGKLLIDNDSLAARFWRRPRERAGNGRPEHSALRPRRERQVPI